MNLKILKQLSELDTHSHRVALIQKEFLGTRKSGGSARICIPLNKKWVLKVAKNEKGIAQNTFEAECYKHASTYEKRYLAKVKKYCTDGKWLIQQRVKPLPEEKGYDKKEEFFKLPSFCSMIKSLQIDESDIDQIGMVGKQYKLYDYGLSPQIYSTYYR